MKHVTEKISLQTRWAIEFVDITDRVKRITEESHISNGLVVISTEHTTTAIKINERCERLQEDMLALLSRMVPDTKYKHDEDTVDGRPNAKAHLMSLLLSASETAPVVDGGPLIGGWQSIFFIELDGPREKRTVNVTVIGE